MCPYNRMRTPTIKTEKFRRIFLASVFLLSPSIPTGIQARDVMIAWCHKYQNTTANTWDNDGGGGNFRIRLIANPSSNTIRVDAVTVRPYHQVSGGSGGAGGSL